ncbi:MAG TPA: hypothetical protein VFY06_08630 [Verrucomicrobiae bacterium]|nr:hypothetical protein [Verrucomicrobiae bacterium]
MRLIDFILNLAGLLLWLNWRAARADPINKSRPATLIGTLRRAEPGGMKGWHLAVALGLLLFFRALFYWQIGSVTTWTARLDFGVTTLSFSSVLSGPMMSFLRMLGFSLFSFGLLLGIFYSSLLLLSILRGPMPTHQLVKIQLGRIDDWPLWLKLSLPLMMVTLVWVAAGWPLAWLQVIPHPSSLVHRIEEAVVVALDSYLIWKYLIAALLILHLLNSYIYFGRHPLWSYVNAVTKKMLLPLEVIPLRAGKVDFAPLLGIVIVFLLTELARRALVFVYGWLAR